MIRQLESYLYVLLHSSRALLLLAVCMLAAWLLLNDTGDAVRDVKQVEERIEESAKINADYLGMVKNQADLQEVEELEELVTILRKRQVVAGPWCTTTGILLLIFLLPGITLTPGLTKSRGMGRELQYRSREKVLLSRMLLSWAFCVLLSTGMYILFLRRWTDTSGASPGQLLRNYAVVQFCVLAGVCYSYFMNILFRHTAIAAAMMLLADALLHWIIPGLYLFYPYFLIPYYSLSNSYKNPATLVGPDCPSGTFTWYCAVCLIYVIVCTFLAFRLFRRRAVR